MTEAPFRHPLRVRFVECDMQGIVFNAHYVTWMDIAHTELWREAVGPLPEFQRTGLDFVTAEVTCRYLQPARFDDELDVAVRLDPLTTTSMTSHHTVLRGDTVLAEGAVRHVCVELATMAKASWPAEVRAATARFVVPAPPPA